MLFILDDFIQDEALISEVKRDTTLFPETIDPDNEEEIGYTLNRFHDEACDCFAPYMFWRGWWHSPADTLRKRLIEKIWSTPGILPFPMDDVVGFEYWCRSYRPGQFLNYHVDEDTFLYEKHHQFNAPAWGCVWYGFSEASEGGFLELHEGRIEGNPPEALEKENIEPLLSPPERLERIAYRPNRLITFDAGRRLHETKPAAVGVREVLIVNVWHKDSPPSALETGEFYYE